VSCRLHILFWNEQTTHTMTTATSMSASDLIIDQHEVSVSLLRMTDITPVEWLLDGQRRVWVMQAAETRSEYNP